MNKLHPSCARARSGPHTCEVTCCRGSSTAATSATMCSNSVRDQVSRLKRWQPRTLHCRATSRSPRASRPDDARRPRARSNRRPRRGPALPARGRQLPARLPHRSLVDVPRERVATAIVSSGEHDRRHVRIPRRAAVLGATTELPRRLVELLLTGVNHQPDNSSTRDE